MKLYGLIGYPLSHSFSEKFFTRKFSDEKINARYQLFPIENIDLLPGLLQDNPNLCGLNVTIPYKEKVIPFLNELDETAQSIGAVNVIQIAGSQLKGYNSDVVGFKNSLVKLLKPYHRKALVLGTGGASKGVAFVLRKLGIDYMFVSRTPAAGQLSYAELTSEIIGEYTLIINTSPVGTFPHVKEYPDIPYVAISERHLLYDLIYNPAETLFLQKGKAQGATVKNGLEMLHGQALAAWDIWNK